MRFSKEKLNELRAKIRLELVKNPNASIYELQDILRKDYGRKFDKNFIGKLKRKIHRERAFMHLGTISEEIAKLAEFIECGRPELVAIVFNEDGHHKPREQIRAFKAVIDADMLLIEAKRNAGLYAQRKDVPEQLSQEDKALLKRALLYANERGRIGEGENVDESKK